MNINNLPETYTLTILKQDALLDYFLKNPRHREGFGLNARGPDVLWTRDKIRDFSIVAMNHTNPWRTFITIRPDPPIWNIQKFSELLKRHRDYMRHYFPWGTEYVWLIEFCKVRNAPHAHLLYDTVFSPSLILQLQDHWLNRLRFFRSNDSYYVRILGLDSSSKFVAMYLSKSSEQKYPREANLARLGRGARLWNHSRGLRSPEIYATMQVSKAEMFDIFGQDWLHRYNGPYRVIHAGHATVRARYPHLFDSA